MKQLIRDFCENEQNTENILTIDLPTGTGKTTTVVDYMTDRIKRGVPGRMVFTTTLRNNLPVDEIKAAFDKAGIRNKFDSEVMICKPTLEAFKDGLMLLDDSDFDNMETWLGNHDTVSKIRRIRDTISALNSKGNILDRDTIEKAFGPDEKEFRKILKKKLKDTYKSPVYRRRAVTTDAAKNNLDWIQILYPAVKTWDCRILLMSVHKFIHRYDTIIGSNTRFCDSDFLDDSVVFMDEFDAAWNTILQVISENSPGMADQVSLFRRIMNGLEHRYSKPSSMYDVTEAFSKKYGENGLLDYADSLYKEGTEIAKEHHLYHDYKLTDGLKRKFIFHDHRTLNIGKNDRFNVRFDEKKQVNIISDKNDGEGAGIDHLFGDLYYFFRYFEEYVRNSAYNYHRIQNEKGHEISIESAIRSVLNQFDFKEGHNDYFMDSILGYRYRNRNKADLNDLSVYNRGYRYHSFEDNDTHDFFTKIGMRAVTSSPESILLNVLGHDGLKFVGVSATANIDTVTGNFNFHYMTNYPEIFRHYKLSPEEEERLNDFVTKRLGNYDGKVNIDVELIDSEGSESIFLHAEFQHRFMEMTRNMDDFDKARFVRLVKAYRMFVESKGTRSMIAFMNLLPKSSGVFNRNDISRAFTMVLEEYGDENSPAMDQPYVVLNAYDFNNTKKNIIDMLSDGKKMFVLTTYQSVGAGQNLQYKIPCNTDVIFVGDDPQFDNGLKDFDAIYLDTPTNIVPEVHHDSASDLVKTISMVEFLHYSSEITNQEKTELIRWAFNGYMGIPASRPSMKDKDSFKAAYARKIIQAIGRICRTHNKNPCIHIMADIGLAEVFVGDINRYGNRFNREFVALFNKLRELNRSKTASVPELDSQADRICSGYINRLCSSDKDGWTDGEMNAWKNMREFALRYPTCSLNPGSNVGSNMYVRLPSAGKSLRYTMEGDYEHVVIREDGDHEVSEKQSRLDKLIHIPCVKEYFESEGYSTAWKEDDRVMSPTFFNNIYKGALGEAAGKAILESFGIMLQEITDGKVFEKFDYITRNGIFIDFKHWSSAFMDEREGVEKSIRKLRQIGGKTAVVINILKPDNSDCRPKHSEYGEDVKLITIPYLYNEKYEINPDAIRALNEVMRR